MPRFFCNFSSACRSPLPRERLHIGFQCRHLNGGQISVKDKRQGAVWHLITFPNSLYALRGRSTVAYPASSPLFLSSRFCSATLSFFFICEQGKRDHSPYFATKMLVYLIYFSNVSYLKNDL